MLRNAALTLLIPAATLLLVHCSSPASASGPRALAADDVHATASRTGGADTPAAQRAEDEVRVADAAEVQAFLDVDPGALARLWSDDFVVTNPFNQFLDKQQVLALVNNGILAFSAYDRHADYVHAYGDMVIVAGRETVVWAGHIPLAGQTSQLRYTAVWARHGDTWQEVARHASIVKPGAPAGP